MSSSVLLLSGGIESATLLYQEQQNQRVVPLFVDYAQKNRTQELAAALALCDRLGLLCHQLDLHRCGEQFRALSDVQWHVPLPHRNLPIVALALSFAQALDIHNVMLSLNRDDLEHYSSAQGDFLQQLKQLARSLNMSVTTPLIELSKTEVIALGTQLGVDYSLTYSCLRGKVPPCGQCPQCEQRQAAFAANGLTDPSIRKTTRAN